MLPSTRQPLALVGEGSPSAPAWGCSSLPSHSSMTWKEVRGEGRLHRWGALGRRGNGCRWGPGDLIWGRGGVRARPRRLELVWLLSCEHLSRNPHTCPDRLILSAEGASKYVAEHGQGQQRHFQ